MVAHNGRADVADVVGFADKFHLWIGSKDSNARHHINLRISSEQLKVLLGDFAIEDHPILAGEVVHGLSQNDRGLVVLKNILATVGLMVDPMHLKSLLRLAPHEVDS